MAEMAEAIRALAAEKGISEESVRLTIENTIKAAYKKTFGTDENCIVVFNDDMSDLSVYSRRKIVDTAYDATLEIELEDALKLSAECQLGDEIDILVDPHNFARSAVSTGKQTAHQAFRESYKDNLYNEYKDKVGQIIVGNNQREHKGNVYIDLGKVEGVLTAKNRIPHEEFQKNERIRAIVTAVKRTNMGIQLTLSRTDPKFVEAILELEVPEIADRIVSVHKVVREAGYRTKIAVYSNRSDVDAVGACVGLKGSRIQNVIQELNGEKIDVLKYSEDPHVFIKNALLPAEVKRVVITDSEKRQAVAVVADSQFALAIGKNGQNARLANSLCDWMIDVKTEEKAAEMDLTETDSRRAAEQLFSNTIEENASEDYDEIPKLTELPGIETRIAALLKDAGLEEIEDFMEAVETGAVKNINGLSAQDIETVTAIINENVEFEEEVSEEPAPYSESSQEEEYFCPECGAKIALDMTRCPKCGVELVFKEE